MVREKPGFRTEWSAEGFVIAGSTRNPLRRGIPDQVRDDVVQHGGDGSVIAGSTRNPPEEEIPDQVRDDVVQHDGEGSGMTVLVRERAGLLPLSHFLVIFVVCIWKEYNAL